jgi:uncharacterized delta-60 repeat protein
MMKGMALLKALGLLRALLANGMQTKRTQGTETNREVNIRKAARRGWLLLATALSFALLTGLALAAPGKLDPGFGTRGIVSTATAPGAGTDRQNGLAIQPDRRILVAGSSDVVAGEFQWRIARYTSKGALDASFGSGGTVLTPMGSSGSLEHILELAVQPDGKIVAAGRALTPTGGVDFALARYLTDGRRDSSFGNGGKVFTAIGPGTNADEALSAVLDASGRIVVAGFTRTGTGPAGNDFALARYLPDGRLDSSFNPGGRQPGIVVIDVTGGRDQFNDVAIDASGRIVAAGSVRGAGPGDFAVARFLPDGSLDSSFNPGGSIPGIVTAPMAPGDNPDAATSIAIDAAERITVGGFAFNEGFIFDLGLARFKPDGSLDTTFGTGGKVLTNVGPGNTDDSLEELVIQPTGKILVGGGTAVTEFFVDSDFMVARYNSDGSLDGSFGTGGIVVTPTAPGNADDEIFAIGLQSDAKLIAAGECVRPSTGRDVCLARYKVGESD